MTFLRKNWLLLILLGFLFFIIPPATTQAQNTECKVTYARFKILGSTDVNPNYVFDDDNPFAVNVMVETSGCTQANEITIELLEGTGGGFLNSNQLQVGDGLNTRGKFKRVRVGNDGRVVVNLRAGESWCTNSSEPNCNYFLRVKTDEVSDWYSTSETLYGRLQYSCSTGGTTRSTSCDTSWEFQSIIPDQNSNGIILDPSVGVNATPIDSSCLDPDTGDPIAGCVALLSPVPNLATFDTNRGLGGYINVIVQLLIGVATLLAVIMIIVGGIQYMTTDAIAGKSEARKTIQRAVGGLLLALASWLILYTINPDLVDTSPEVETVTLEWGGGLGIILSDSVVYTSSTTDDPSEVDTTWAYDNAPVLTFEDNGTIVEVRACDRSKMDTIQAFGRSIQIHESLVDRVRDISNEWSQRSDEYPIPSPADAAAGAAGAGGYYCRTVGNNPNILSMHAYGIAIDINPVENPYGPTLVTDMPVWFRELWLSRGFGWGGAWNSVKDAMHFSKSLNEGGDQVF